MLGYAGAIAAKGGVVFQRLPGKRIVVIADPQEAAEAPFDPGAGGSPADWRIRSMGHTGLSALTLLEFDKWMFPTVGIDRLWRSAMLVRPRDLADQMSGEQPPEIFTPLDAARCKRT